MKISIITTISNNVKNLKFTLDSVMFQTYRNYEHIIINNGNNEKALEIASLYPQLTNLFSYQGSNLFHMLNRGIKNSTGDIILFLDENSYLGDKNTLQLIVDIFKSKEIDGLLGSIVYLNNREPIKIQNIFNASKFSKAWFNLGGVVSYSSFILKKDVYNKYGMFDKKFKILGDYEFALRLTFKHNIIIEPIKNTIFYKFDDYNRDELHYTTHDIFQEYKHAWNKNSLNYNYIIFLLKYLRKFFTYLNIYYSPKWLSHTPPSHCKFSYLNEKLGSLIKM